MSADLVKKMARDNARFKYIAFSKEVLGLLNCKSNSSNKYVMTHLKNLLNKNNDMSRLKTLTKLYKIVGKYKNGDVLKNFYNWYKYTPISREDYKIYRIYCKICKEYNFDGKIIPTNFSQVSTNLKGRLLDWLDGGGNDINDVLIEYFMAVIQTCFKKSLVYNPKSLLSTFGWDLFMEYIRNNYGDKRNYITPSKEKLSSAKTVTEKLLKINELKSLLLVRGHPDLADVLMDDLHRMGLDYTYETYVTRR